jgi:hypothetical protein
MGPVLLVVSLALPTTRAESGAVSERQEGGGHRGEGESREKGSTPAPVSAIKPYEGFGDVDHTIKELMSF